MGTFKEKPQVDTLRGGDGRQPRLSREGLLFVSGGPVSLPAARKVQPAAAFSSHQALSRLLQRVLGLQWPEGSYSEEQPPRHHTLWPWLNPGKGQPLMREAAPPHPRRALEVRALGSPGQTCSQRAGLWWWKPPPPTDVHPLCDARSSLSLHPASPTPQKWLGV